MESLSFHTVEYPFPYSQCLYFSQLSVELKSPLSKFCGLSLNLTILMLELSILLLELGILLLQLGILLPKLGILPLQLGIFLPNFTILLLELSILSLHLCLQPFSVLLLCIIYCT